MDAKEALKLVHSEVMKHLKTASDYYQTHIEPPVIRVDLKSNQIAGRCNSDEILINRGFLIKNLDGMINETIPHETAHWIQHQLYDQLNHRRTWKEACKVIVGRELPTRHDFGYLKYYKVECDCRQFELSPVRGKKLIRYPQYYRCTKCGSDIRFV